MPVPDAPEVTIAAGTLRGEQTGAVDVFRGIPFAAPPVGALRWCPPAPAGPWQGVRDATRFGDDCPQRSAIPIGSRAAAQSEDCLTLNIWAPADRGDGPLPVMVWVFGGSFVFGSGAEERGDGTNFARDGVIFVSINYRTGMFGFLAHPGLTAEQGTSGNYGLLDQIAALRWVRDNIASFGGDPDRVTLFGVSAGAASISLLLTSPLAAGLFRQVILQSPGAFRPLATLAEAEAAGARLDPDVDALRALSPEQLLDLQKLIEPAVRSLTAARVLRPIHDGTVIPRQDADAFLSGAFHSVPAIVGTVADEGSNAVAAWPVNDRTAFAAMLAANFGDHAAEAGELYPVAADGEAKVRLGELFGDTQFTYGAAALSGVFARACVPTWRYVLTRHRPGHAAPRHSEDVSYVFDRPGLPPRGDNDHRFDAADVALATTIHRAWVSFAATGSPGMDDWQSYDSDRRTMIEFGDIPRPRDGWREPQMAFLARYFAHDF